MFNFYFSYSHQGTEQQLAVSAENVKVAREIAKSIGGDNLHYTGDYDIAETDPFEGQEIAWVCSKPVEELPFPFSLGKRLALFFAYGTNCQCCLGYRIMAGIVLGVGLGYLLGV